MKPSKSLSILLALLVLLSAIFFPGYVSAFSADSADTAKSEADMEKAYAAPGGSNNKGTWTSKANMNYKRQDFTAVTINGKIYAVGGNQNIEEYDPIKNQWTVITQIPSNNYSGISAAALNGKIYVMGAGESDSLQVYDLSNNKWTKLAPMNTARTYASAAAYKGKIYITGGATNYQSSNSVEVYDPDSDSWSSAPSMSKGRSFHSLAVLEDKMYVIGGDSSSCSVEEFDFQSNVWTQKSDSPYKIDSAGSAVLDGKIYIVGGSSTPQKLIQYDPNNNNNNNNNTWEEKQDLISERSSLAAASLNGKIYAMGGVDFVTKNTVEEYTPESLVTSSPSPTPFVTATPSSKTISGKILLPDTTFSKDMTVEVFAELDSGTSYSSEIKISKQLREKPYSIEIPNTALSKKFRLGYSLKDAGDQFAQTAYYTSNGSTFDKKFADELEINSNITGKDMDILVKRNIKGEISLPGDEKAPQGGFEVDLVLYYRDTDFVKGYKSLKIPKDSKSVKFNFNVFENDKNSKYFLSYLVSKEGYMKTGFYNKNGTSNTIRNATPIDISSNDAVGINFTISHCKKISGTISLPGDDRAPKNGLLVSIYAQDKDNSLETNLSVRIPNGEKSAKFTMDIPDSFSSEIYFYYFTCEPGYVNLGYFAEGSTSAYLKDASLINTESSIASNISMTLINGVDISGKVYLPDGQPAPEGGMDIFMFAGSDIYKSDFISVVNIEEGKNNTDYTLTVLPGEYYIGYTTDQDGFVNRGLLSNNGEPDVFYDLARKVPVNSALYNVDFKIAKGIKVTGKVKLPTGTASKDIELEVFVENSETTAEGPSVNVIIPKGSNEAPFTIYLPADSYAIGYYNKDYQNNGYEKLGYRGISGMVKNSNEIYGEGYINLFNSQPKSNIILTLISTSASPTSNVSPTPGQSNPSPGGAVPNQGTNNTVPSSGSTPAPVSTPASSAKSTEKPAGKVPLAANFNDISNHWAKDNIVKLLSLSIIDGYPDKTIKPDNKVTRAEISKLLLKMLKLAPMENTDLSFSDKPSIPAWAKGYIALLSKLEVIKGFEDKSFRPLNKITRKEMVVMILRAYGYKNENSGSKYYNFIDRKDIPAWAEGYIYKAVEMGLVKGYSDNSFRPNAYITRAEAFTMIIRAIELNIKKP